MAIKLTDKPNTAAPTADFPYGNIIDETGGGNGTPVSRMVYSDIHQFFERLMVIAGITHNGNVDNATNGFQLVDALVKYTGSGAWTDIGNPTLVPNTGTASVHSVSYNRYIVSGKTLDWHFAVSITPTGSPTTIKVVLPSWVSPTGSTIVPVTTTPGANAAVGVYRSMEPLICSMDSTHITLSRTDTGSGPAPFVNTSGYIFSFKIRFEITYV